MPISADAQKQQRLQLQQESGSAAVSVSSESKTATALTDQEQRNTLKFGFSAKGTASKVCPTGIMVLNCILPSTTMESVMLTTRLHRLIQIKVLAPMFLITKSNRPVELGTLQFTGWFDPVYSAV